LSTRQGNVYVPMTHQVPPGEIQDALERVLASREFRTTPRCCEFLKYVVDTALSGRAADLKERTIGVDVFKRPTSYDPGNDAVVRVKAREVRKRLSIYYATEGANETLRIGLPVGAYVPTFRQLQPECQTGKGLEHPGVQAGISWSYGPLSVRAPGVPAPPISAGSSRVRPVLNALEQFWLPILYEDAPVSLCASSVPVYRPKNGTPAGMEDLALVQDGFVALGDISATSCVADMFLRLRQPYRFLIGNNSSPSDLRTAPVVFIGYSYTYWHQISRHGRYCVNASAVLDNGVERWKLSTFQDDPDLREDYAVVSRFWHAENAHGNVVVVIVGISHFGTESAAHLMTDPVLSSAVLAQLPAAWHHRNLQMVLRVKIAARRTEAPELIATHVW
jgi:hypothetical protein